MKTYTVYFSETSDNQVQGRQIQQGVEKMGI